MKNSEKFSFVVLLILVAGCSQMFFDNYQRFDDEFKNNTKLIARVILQTEERRSEINSAYVIFERVISGNEDHTKAYFVIARSTSSFKIEPEGYLKADNQSFKINIQNPVTEYKTKTETSVSTFSKTDSSGVHTGQTTDVDEHNWIDDKFIFELSNEMILNIKKSEEFIVRFYFGPIPATFRFKGSKIGPVQKILNE